MSIEGHNNVLLPLLKLMVEAEETESGQWIILESLSLGIGKLHGRTLRQTAEFVEAMAERLTNGSRA